LVIVCAAVVHARHAVARVRISNGFRVEVFAMR